jgi:hypothetical protein
MHVTHRLIALTAVCGLALGAETARAQEADIEVDMEAPPPPAVTPYDRPEDGVVVIRQEAPEARVDVEVEEEHDIYADSIVFLEASAATGVQLGDTEYLPSGTPGDWQFPLVYGFGVGGTAGVMVGDHIALVGTYMYQRAQTRDGHLDGALTNVEGRIDYHTALGGVRLYVPTGFGAFRGEVAVGVVFPHETQLQLDYGPALGGLPQPIPGSGYRTSRFSVGIGGQARIGYEIPIAGPLYAALDLQLQVFQAENSGEETRLENFVTDFTAPRAVNATILHGDGAERPQTRGVSSGLGVLSVGVRL